MKKSSKNRFRVDLKDERALEMIRHESEFLQDEFKRDWETYSDYEREETQWTPTQIFKSNCN